MYAFVCAREIDIYRERDRDSEYKNVRVYRFWFS